MLLHPFSNTVPKLIEDSRQMIETLKKDYEDRKNHIEQKKKSKQSSHDNLKKLIENQKRFKQESHLDPLNFTSRTELLENTYNSTTY